MRTWLRGGLLVLMAAGMFLAGVPALATHGGVHGHCDANNNPVVDYGPPGWQDEVTVHCTAKGMFYLRAKKLFEEPKDRLVMVRPDDFARWVNISLNDMDVRNPYDDVFPYIVKSSGRTLVPLRYLSEAFGAKVDWNDDKQEAGVNWRGRTITVPIGKDSAIVDGHEVRLDQPALLWKERTMVPLRFLAEAVGAKVEWDDVNSFVHITLDGVECPPTYCGK